MSNLCVILVLLGLALPGPVAMAQAAVDSITVPPGHSLLDPERLVPHQATWRVTRRDPDGGSAVQGLWTDTWVRSTDAGRQVVIFRQLFVDTAGTVQWDAETVFDAATLAGIRSVQRIPTSGFGVTYRYTGDTASGTLRSSGSSEPRAFQVVFDEPVWEPLAPVPVLLPLERLEHGAVVRYPIWDQRTGVADDVTWREMRVDSLGSVEVAQGRSMRVWYVTLSTANQPNTTFRLRRTPDPPYYAWFVVERPTLTREWTLVHWEPYAPSPRLPGQ